MPTVEGLKDMTSLRWLVPVLANEKAEGAEVGAGVGFAINAGGRKMGADSSTWR
jgi:hypothetical protein